MSNLPTMCPYCGSRVMRPYDKFPEVFKCTNRACQKLSTLANMGAK